MGAFLNTMLDGAYVFAERVVALLLLALITVLVVDPIWEIHDHLDTLRHLGPHGVLIIMLMVALAGVSLLKCPRWLLIFVRWGVAGMVACLSVPYPVSAGEVSSVLVTESGPPLRI